MQISAPPFQEGKVLQVAHAYERTALFYEIRIHQRRA
jgi:hypothetical protein